VVALGRGGARETVVDGVTGVLVEPGVEALADGMQRAAALTWDTELLRRHADAFSRARFVTEIQEAIDETMAAPPGHRW
jgi:glycosyltransferase involved in cell wall biosynthesis